MTKEGNKIMEVLAGLTPREKIQRGYMVTIGHGDDLESPTVAYVPRKTQVSTSGKGKKVTAFHAKVKLTERGAPVNWDALPASDEVTPEEFAADARHRARLACDWLAALSRLIANVDCYAKELGWSTRRIDKPMEDSEIGKYSAPALLLQEETTKVLLEPITRSAPGTEGIVDLYLMPGYDDIASLYYLGKRWNLHYVAPEQKAVARPREAEARPLTKATLRKVLEEMKAHAQ